MDCCVASLESNADLDIFVESRFAVAGEPVQKLTCIMCLPPFLPVIIDTNAFPAF